MKDKDLIKDLSVVVPLYNEDESLNELNEWIVQVVNANNLSYEIIYVDDGSNDKSWEVIEKLAKDNSNIKGLQFRRNIKMTGTNWLRNR